MTSHHALAQQMLWSVRVLFLASQPAITAHDLLENTTALRNTVPVYCAVVGCSPPTRLAPHDAVFRLSDAGTLPAVVFGGAYDDSGTCVYSGWQIAYARELEQAAASHDRGMCVLHFLPLPTALDIPTRPFSKGPLAPHEEWTVLGNVWRASVDSQPPQDQVDIVPGALRVSVVPKRGGYTATLAHNQTSGPLDARAGFVAHHSCVGHVCVSSARRLVSNRTSQRQDDRMAFPCLSPLPSPKFASRHKPAALSYTITQGTESAFQSLVSGWFQRITASAPHLYALRITHHGPGLGPSVVVTPGPHDFLFDLRAAAAFGPSSLAEEVYKSLYGASHDVLILDLKNSLSPAAVMELRDRPPARPLVVLLLNTQREASETVRNGHSTLYTILLGLAGMPPSVQVEGVVFCFDTLECPCAADTGPQWLWITLRVLLGAESAQDMCAPYLLDCQRALRRIPVTVIGPDPIKWVASHGVRGTCAQPFTMYISDACRLQDVHSEVEKAVRSIPPRRTDTRSLVVLHMPEWMPADAYSIKDADAQPWRLPRGWIITQTAEQLWVLHRRCSTRIRGLVLIEASAARPPLSTVVACLIWRHQCDYLLRVGVVSDK